MTPKPLVVLDINLQVSGVVARNSPPHKVLTLWHDDEIELAISELMIQKLEDVLRYPKVVKYTRMSAKERHVFLALFRESAILVAGNRNVQVCPDDEDNLVFACALEARANYIVSGDKKHVLPIKRYKGIKVVSAAEFLTLLS
ncbi:putative toxin-antitoxin system toxin component, PIN family [Candidatus Microgenomates bacterium]|nr:MAG: putative toxin-antitoxin system toxin component, PIN family [Candidatus Microgenomates bacterium]